MDAFTRQHAPPRGIANSPTTITSMSTTNTRPANGAGALTNGGGI